MCLLTSKLDSVDSNDSPDSLLESDIRCDSLDGHSLNRELFDSISKISGATR